MDEGVIDLSVWDDRASSISKYRSIDSLFSFPKKELDHDIATFNTLDLLKAACFEFKFYLRAYYYSQLYDCSSCGNTEKEFYEMTDRLSRLSV